LSESSFSAAIAKARTAGREVIDLTVSNPTRCGFAYDADAVLGALGSSQEALVYDPDPCGMRSARKAVAGYYADHGAVVDAASIVLTTSTSEAYSYLFRLICDAGDEVLVAQPSYPLFEFLADLDDVRLKPFPLFYDFGWWIDFAELERRIGPTTRAILVVHPNNPTGHWTHKAERDRLEALCERRGLALIVDEVFLDYPICSSAASFAIGPHRALTFVLSGISKVAALPQMKVAWVAAFGPGSGEALARLEVIGDTFLSMNAPTQIALPAWLGGRGDLQAQIKARVQANLEVLRAAGIDVLHLEAGWSAVLRLRGTDADATAAEALLAEAGVIVHPGEFYGLSDRRMAIVSLITPAEIFRAGVGRICPVPATKNLVG
jgi:aspartate/methionine/tyrosine aminotransferase